VRRINCGGGWSRRNVRVCPRPGQWAKRFTVAAEFIKKAWGMCEDQHCVAFLNAWLALFVDCEPVNDDD
jgi:hypothetical protein